MKVLPMDIENESFKIITEELGDIVLDPMQAPIIKRAIHTSADFDYAKNLVFSENVVPNTLQILKDGCTIVTDTNMGLSGVNKMALSKLNCEAMCFMSDEDVAKEAKAQGTTRAVQCMKKAAKIEKPLIIAVGNAPTALLCLDEMIKKGEIKPSLIIGVPVGFVNVVESKEIIMQSGVPYIVAKGRKGGSNIAASIINALMYMASPREM